MNKSSVKKKRAAKAGRNSAVRKSPSRATGGGRATAGRKVAAKSATRRQAQKPQAGKSVINGLSAIKAISAIKPVSEPVETSAAPITVAQVTSLVATLRTHRFQVGQTVFYTSSPISRPGASGTYKVVRLLPSDGDDYQYRIKNPGEAFERVAKESQLEIEP
jgi:hypothetical protein